MDFFVYQIVCDFKGFYAPLGKRDLRFEPLRFFFFLQRADRLSQLVNCGVDLPLCLCQFLASIFHVCAAFNTSL